MSVWWEKRRNSHEIWSFTWSFESFVMDSHIVEKEVMQHIILSSLCLDSKLRKFKIGPELFSDFILILINSIQIMNVQSLSIVSLHSSSYLLTFYFCFLSFFHVNNFPFSHHFNILFSPPPEKKSFTLIAISKFKITLTAYKL